MRPQKLIAVGLALAALLSAQNGAKDDPLLRAMRDEVERARGLKLENLEHPYYVEFSVDEQENYGITASLGALYAPTYAQFRIPRVRVRVGSMDFDNTGYAFSDYYSGARYDSEQLPLDNDYSVLRRTFWLAADRAYKGAVEAIARKRAALRNITQQEALPDFRKAEPAVKLLPAAGSLPSVEGWPERARKLSATFLAYPEVSGSSVALDGSYSTYYFHNSEGSTVRLPEKLIRYTVRANGQAANGTNVRDGVQLVRHDASSLPSDAQLQEQTKAIAENVKALVSAPVGEDYSGPVLFEGIAAPQIIAEVLAPNLSLPRRPVNEPSRPAPFLSSELEGRVGSRILPEFFDVIDNPLETIWNGVPLFGSYPIDEEGVIPKPLTLVEKGRLKEFLRTRQGVPGFDASNGRARIPGAYGASSALISNLFVRSSETVKNTELRARMLKMIKDRNKPYGIVIRKMDFPTTAPTDELRRIVMSSNQRGNSRPVSTPTLTYRVYPDGREELVRGLRFRMLNVRALRDILVTGDESYAFHYLNTALPFAMQTNGYMAAASVIAPAFLIDDVELERTREELPKLPVVPAPALSAGNGQ